jgi:hypothetical protein
MGPDREAEPDQGKISDDENLMHDNQGLGSCKVSDTDPRQKLKVRIARKAGLKEMIKQAFGEEIRNYEVHHKSIKSAVHIIITRLPFFLGFIVNLDSPLVTSSTCLYRLLINNNMIQ